MSYTYLKPKSEEDIEKELLQYRKKIRKLSSVEIFWNWMISQHSELDNILYEELVYRSTVDGDGQDKADAINYLKDIGEIKRRKSGKRTRYE